jgi:hypothetical protein
MEGLTGECLDSLQTAADDTDFADRNKQQKHKETKAAKVPAIKSDRHLTSFPSLSSVKKGPCRSPGGSALPIRVISAIRG